MEKNTASKRKSGFLWDLFQVNFQFRISVTIDSTYRVIAGDTHSDIQTLLSFTECAK